jgi:dTDP-glucose pyrophosphorylase
MIKNFLISYNKSLEDALKKISKNSSKAVVVTKNNFFLGVLTDGDIRRAILKKNNINSKIDKFYNKNAKFLEKGKFSKTLVQDLFLNNKYDIIPVLEKGRVVDILTWDRFFKTKSIQPINIPVIIMAGGFGKRLMPITNILPKALVPIKGKPIIDYILDELKTFGLYRFYIVTNYYADLIKSYLTSKDKLSKFSFIKEKKPLGTIGGIKLIRFNDSDNNLFITNCDTILKADYADIVNFHNVNNNDLTVIASYKKTQIAYGVCHLNSHGDLDYVDEKPSFTHLINCGFYLINKKLINLIPKNSKFDFVDLIKKAKIKKKKIGIYPVAEDQWIDIGQWNEYQKAVDII